MIVGRANSGVRGWLDAGAKATEALPLLPNLLHPPTAGWNSEVLEFVGGAEEDRTPDLCSAIAALSQLSYGP